MASLRTTISFWILSLLLPFTSLEARKFVVGGNKISWAAPISTGGTSFEEWTEPMHLTVGDRVGNHPSHHDFPSSFSHMSLIFLIHFTLTLSFSKIFLHYLAPYIFMGFFVYFHSFDQSGFCLNSEVTKCTN
jgi:hypothetical protein